MAFPFAKRSAGDYFTFIPRFAGCARVPANNLLFRNLVLHFHPFSVCSRWIRTLIESVIPELKTQMHLEHSQHRSFDYFQVKVLSALIAYQLLENRPSLSLTKLQQINDLLILPNN